MTRPWTEEERAWARECYHAGDSLADIAEAAGRTLEDVRAVVGSGLNLTDRQRSILELYTAGCSAPEIAVALNLCGDHAASDVRNSLTRMRRKGIDIPRRRAGRRRVAA